MVVVTKTGLKGFITTLHAVIILAVTWAVALPLFLLSFCCLWVLYCCLRGLGRDALLYAPNAAPRVKVRNLKLLHCLCSVPRVQRHNHKWMHCNRYRRVCEIIKLHLRREFRGLRQRVKTFWFTLGLQCLKLIHKMSNEESSDFTARRRANEDSKVYSEEELQEHAAKSRAINDVDLAAQDSYSDLMKKYESRFNKLKESCFRELSGVSISNSGWETGRPKAVIADNLKGDSANIFTRPSIDALLVRNAVPESNNMATAEELARISAKVQALGAPEEHLAEVFWDVAKYCATSGSSPAVNPQGTIQLGGRTITRDMVFAVIKEYSTLRRVCRSYAPITWNNMLLNDQPPANWDAKGFTEETKFAAFDVFDAVTNKAAIQPLEGLIRHPTQAERIAYATHKKLALERSSQNSRFANTSAEVTGGLFGCSPKNNFRESRC
nr:CP [Garlic yellow virus]QED44833.1 CP [Garlic yellow virus]